jgi:hypothetical protein
MVTFNDDVVVLEYVLTDEEREYKRLNYRITMMKLYYYQRDISVYGFIMDDNFMNDDFMDEEFDFRELFEK